MRTLQNSPPTVLDFTKLQSCHVMNKGFYMNKSLTDTNIFKPISIQNYSFLVSTYTSYIIQVLLFQNRFFLTTSLLHSAQFITLSLFILSLTQIASFIPTNLASDESDLCLPQTNSHRASRPTSVVLLLPTGTERPWREPIAMPIITHHLCILLTIALSVLALRFLSY